MGLNGRPFTPFCRTAQRLLSERFRVCRATDNKSPLGASSKQREMDLAAHRPWSKGYELTGDGYLMSRTLFGIYIEPLAVFEYISRRE